MGFNEYLNASKRPVLFAVVLNILLYALSFAVIRYFLNYSTMVTYIAIAITLLAYPLNAIIYFYAGYRASGRFGMSLPESALVSGLSYFISLTLITILTWIFYLLTPYFGWPSGATTSEVPQLGIVYVVASISILLVGYIIHLAIGTPANLILGALGSVVSETIRKRK